MKVLSHDEFHELDYNKRKILAGAVAKKWIEKFEGQALNYKN